VAEVLIQGGKAYLKNPLSGETMGIPVAQAREYLGAGVEPATMRDWEGIREKEAVTEKYGETGAGALALLAGAGRSLSLGLSDVALTKLGGVDPGTLRGLEQASPTATTIGEVGGALGSMLIPGGPVARLAGAAGKVGAGAAAATAKVLAKEASTFLPRLAGTVAREATMGAGFGLGQAVSQATLSSEQMSGLEILEKLASGAGRGAAFGAGLGALGVAASEGVRGVRRAAGAWKGIDGLRAARGEARAATAELEAAQASGVTGQAARWLEDKALGLGGVLKEAQVELTGRLFSKAIGVGLGSILGGGVGGVVGFLTGPGVVGKLAKAIAPKGAAAGELTSRLKKTLTPNLSEVERVAKAEMIEAKGRMSEWYKGNATLDPQLQTATPIAEATKEVEQQFAARLSQALVQKVFPGAKKAVFDQLTDAQLRDLSREVQHIDPAELDVTLRSQYPVNLPPQIGDAITKQCQRTIDFLKMSSPPLQDGKLSAPSAVEASKLRARYEVVLRPERFLELFGDGRLTMDHLAAWKAVYPEALDQIRSVIKSEQARAQAQGLEHTRQQAHQIALVQGGGAGRLYDPQTVALLQASHAAAQEQPPPRTRPPKVARQHQTTMNRLAGEG